MTLHRYAFIALAIAGIFAAGCATAPVVTPPPAESAFHQRVMRDYAIPPRELIPVAAEPVHRAWEALWNDVRADRERLLPELRRELAHPGVPPFFRYDGSRLLLSLSDAPSDRDIAAGAIALCDPGDVVGTEYVETVATLGRKGADVSGAALRVLDIPHFHAFSPPDPVAFNVGESLIYMLFSMPEERWVAKAAAKYQSVKSDDGRQALVLALHHSTTPEGDAVVRGVIVDNATSSQMRAFAASLVDRERRSNAAAPEHVATVWRSLAFDDMLKTVVPAMMDARQGKGGPDAAASLAASMRPLWTAGVEMGREMVRDAVGDNTLPSVVRDAAKAVVAQSPPTDPIVAPSSADLPTLLLKRRAAISRLNEESFQEFARLSGMIRWVRAR